ncbi:MAG: ParB/RepB/Spo0J family partition protein [Thermoanaerobaculia bacterium]|nr:ParB/RepB/Spo0J family partition protein [Thermoanaerobaculia bacterium]
MRHGSHFVEELAARSDEPVGKMVPISQIEPDANQPRSTMGDLSDLVASIRDKGILEPLLVRPIPEGNTSGRSYLIISGERRYRAAMQAGVVDVPVIVMEVGEDEALEIALIENLQRKDLTPFEEAEGYQALAERFNYTHEAIAEAVGKSRTVITESFALLQMSHKVRETAQALGINSKSLLLEVLKCDDEAEMVSLLEEVARRGLSRDDLRLQKRGEKDGDELPRRRPFVFKLNAPDKSYSLALKFRQTQVSKDELIDVLEKVLVELRQS